MSDLTIRPSGSLYQFHNWQWWGDTFKDEVSYIDAQAAMLFYNTNNYIRYWLDAIDKDLIGIIGDVDNIYDVELSDIKGKIEYLEAADPNLQNETLERHETEIGFLIDDINSITWEMENHIKPQIQYAYTHMVTLLEDEIPFIWYWINWLWDDYSLGFDAVYTNLGGRISELESKAGFDPDILRSEFTAQLESMRLGIETDLNNLTSAFNTSLQLAINHTLSIVETMINPVIEKVNSQQTKINDILLNKLPAINDRLIALEAGTTIDIDAIISALRDEFTADLSAVVNALSPEIEKVNNRVTELDNRLTARITTDISTVKSSLSELESKVDNEFILPLKDIESRVSNMENISLPAINASILEVDNRLTGMIEDVRNSVTILDAELSHYESLVDRKIIEIQRDITAITDRVIPGIKEDLKRIQAVYIDGIYTVLSFLYAIRTYPEIVVYPYANQWEVVTGLLLSGGEV